MAAKCYQCVPKAVWGPTVISLLCQWAQNSGTVECGAVSGFITLGGGSDADGFYTQVSPIKWTQAFPFTPSIDFNGTTWEIVLFGITLYSSDVFPCTWIRVNGVGNAPTGHYFTPTPPIVTWAPNTEIASWNDITGAHNGNLASFQLTADAPTVTNLIFGAIGSLTSINNLDNLTALTGLDVHGNSLTSLSLIGCGALTIVNCSANSMNPANVDLVLCALDVNGAFGGNLDITSNSIPTAAGLVCSANLDPGKGWTVLHD